MTAILMISTKLAPPGLFEINVFRNKGYEVIISVHDVTNNFFYNSTKIILLIWSHGQRSVTLTFLWEKLS